MSSRPLVAVLAFIVMQHFEVLRIGDLGVTVGAISGTLLWLALREGSVRGSRLVGACAASILALGNFLAGDRILGVADFAPTALYFTMFLVVFSHDLSDRGRKLLKSRSFATACLLGLTAIATISLGQTILGYMGNFAFYNPWGSHQFFHEYDYSVSFSILPRAHGFFLEPSYNAFVASTAAALLYMRGWRMRWTTVCLAVVLATSQSATGLLLWAVVLLIVAFKARMGQKFAVVILGAVGAFAGGAYVLERLQSATVSGSSANYRLVAPLELMGQVLSTRPVGYPLGSVESLVAKQYIYLGAERGSSLDNGFYVLVFYFGWFGLVAIMVALFLAIRAMLSHSDPLAAAIPVYVVGSLLFSGAIFNVEFVVATWLVLAMYAWSSKDALFTQRSERIGVS